MYQSFSSSVVNVKRYRCKTFTTSLPALCKRANFFTPSLCQKGEILPLPLKKGGWEGFSKRNAYSQKCQTLRVPRQSRGFTLKANYTNKESKRYSINSLSFGLIRYSIKNSARDIIGYEDDPPDDHRKGIVLNKAGLHLSY